MTTDANHDRALGRPLDVGAVRSGSWALIASFVTFAIGVAATIVTSGDRAQAEQAAADRLGVQVSDLPAVELAKVSQQFPPTGQDIVNVGLLVLATIVFAVAIAIARLGVIPTVLATLTPLGWSTYIVLGVSVTNGAMPPESMLALYDRYALPAMAFSSTVGCLALIVLVLSLRSRGIARRTGIVVMVLAALGAVAAVVLGVPPVLPLLLGAVLGASLVRVKPAAPA
jgi:hypothetical protein